MNILLAAALFLALSFVVAFVVARRLRAMQPPAADSDLDAPYRLLVEPMTPAEREAMWARIEARIDGERQDAA